jgi:Protein of unknown function (DUF4236)
MGNFRFYRRVNIFPGLTVNLSKSGPSLTVGMRGAHVTLGNRSVTRTVGLPGTAIYYTSRAGYHSGVHSAHTDTPVAQPAQANADRLIGFVVIAIVIAVALAIGITIGAALGIH